MSRVSIDASDLSGLARLLDTHALAAEVAKEVLADTIPETPIRTGRLRRSGKIVYTPFGVKIVFDAALPGKESYAGWVHNGTRRMPARPFLLRQGQRFALDADRRIEAAAERLYRGK
jgi:hypothetical protein